MTAPQITRAAGRPKGFPADVAARWGAWRDLHGKGFSAWDSKAFGEGE